MRNHVVRDSRIRPSHRAVWLVDGQHTPCIIVLDNLARHDHADVPHRKQDECRLHRRERLHTNRFAVWHEPLHDHGSRAHAHQCRHVTRLHRIQPIRSPEFVDDRLGLLVHNALLRRYCHRTIECGRIISRRMCRPQCVSSAGAVFFCRHSLHLPRTSAYRN